jgi:hypothetical protein
MLDSCLPGGLIEGSGTLSYAQTMAFTTLIFFQLFNVLNARSDEQSAFRGVVSESLALGRDHGVTGRTSRSDSCPVSPKFFLDCKSHADRMDALCDRRQFRPLAARIEQTHHARKRPKRRVTPRL